MTACLRRALRGRQVEPYKLIEVAAFERMGLEGEVHVGAQVVDLYFIGLMSLLIFRGVFEIQFSHPSTATNSPITRKYVD